MTLRYLREPAVGIFILFLTACVSNQNSKVTYDYDHGYHTVFKGETLYSISFRHGFDYKQIAAWNNIRPPYTIYPGQRLRLTPSPVTSKTYAKKSKSQSTRSTKTARSSKTTTAKKSTSKKSTPSPSKTVSKPINHEWGWPTKGKIISNYSLKTGGNKGIDIAGKEGQGVFAASSGKVVYSGNGLVGYGNLIIVKHSEEYLSAYAHNRKLLVKEGGSVTRGQKIAELGSSGAKSPRLHFEIRRNGKPVDPLKYLPKK